MDHPSPRPPAELARYSQRIVQRGLAVGPGGNISARVGDLMWISPSGYALDEIENDQWCALRIANGEPVSGSARPSSEFQMHLALYRVRPDIAAVIHTHPPTAIGVIGSGLSELPVMFPDQIAIAGAARVLDYIVPCSQALADAAAAAMTDPAANVLLLRNHGLIAVGANLKEAWYRTEVIEDAARVFWIASSLGNPRVLTPAETAEILDLEAEKYRKRLLHDAASA